MDEVGPSGLIFLLLLRGKGTRRNSRARSIYGTTLITAKK